MDKFIQCGIYWWNRQRESYCYSNGVWLYYKNSIVSGERITKLELLPTEIQDVAIAKHQLDTHWR